VGVTLRHVSLTLTLNPKTGPKPNTNHAMSASYTQNENNNYY